MSTSFDSIYIGTCTSSFDNSLSCSISQLYDYDTSSTNSISSFDSGIVILSNIGINP